jgi:hypothetical protein
MELRGSDVLLEATFGTTDPCGWLLLFAEIF